MMRKIIFLLVIVLLSVNYSFSQDKEAVINKIWKATGGKKVFEKSRYIQFAFAGEKDGKAGPARNHLWDRYTGDYRFENEQADAKKVIVLFNVNTQKGSSFINGEATPDSTNQKLLKRAYGAFINDTYWLMTPLKLQDPGVNTFLEKQETIENVTYDVIRLNFDKVGLTPGDQYWLYANTKTGAIERWKFLLQGQKNEASFIWAPYQDLGNGLKLSTRKTNTKQASAIIFPLAKVLNEVNKEKFTKP